MKRRRCSWSFFPKAQNAKNKDISIDPREINEEIRDWNAAAAASRRTRKRKKLFPTVICFSEVLSPANPCERKALPPRPMSCSAPSFDGDAHHDASLVTIRAAYIRLIASARGCSLCGEEDCSLWIMSPYYVRTNNSRYVVYGYGYSAPSLRYDASCVGLAYYFSLYYLITYFPEHYIRSIEPTWINSVSKIYFFPINECVFPRC